MLLLLVGFLACALNTGTNLLYLLVGVLANAFALNLWLAWRVPTRLELAGLAPARVTQQEGFALRVSARSRRGLGVALSVAVEEAAAWGAGIPRVGLAGLPRAEAVAFELSLTAARLGEHPLPRLEVRCQAPFGLIEGRRALPSAGTVLVLPAVRPLRSGLLRPPARQGQALAQRLAFAAERRDVVRSLREHRPGDDPRAIHWRSSARRGTTVVKEFERSAPREAFVLVDLRAEDSADALPRVEAALTLAASVVAELLHGGERVGVGVAGAGPPRLLAPVGGAAGLGPARALLARARPAADPDLGGLARLVRRSGGRARQLLITTRAGSRARSFPAAQRLAVPSPAAAAACFAGSPQ